MDVLLHKSELAIPRFDAQARRAWPGQDEDGCNVCKAHGRCQQFRLTDPRLHDTGNRRDQRWRETFAAWLNRWRYCWYKRCQGASQRTLSLQSVDWRAVKGCWPRVPVEH